MHHANTSWWRSVRILPFLLVLLGLGAPGQAATNEQERARLWYEADAKFYRKNLTHVSEIWGLRGQTAQEAAVRAYEDWKKAGSPTRPMDAEGMRSIYQAAGNDHGAFKLVAKLIAEGKINDTHSQQMAVMRDQLIDARLKEIGHANGWRIARSDSGNQTSGMKSDLDQTFFVFRRDKQTGQWVRDPDLDGLLIEKFIGKWEGGPPITLDALDVASIEGRNRFPHPLDVTVEGYHKEFERVIRALRNTPGAYTTWGAVAQQMQFRAFGAVMADNPRAFRIYEPDEKGNWRKFPPDEFDALPSEERAKWLEQHGSQWHEEAVRTMFGNEPELMKGFAFGTALANHAEMQKYMDLTKKFETKYHLRTWEDAMQVLLLSEEAKAGTADRRQKVEYADLPTAERQKRNAEILKRLFGDNVVKQKRHEIALEISAQQRILHKGKLPEGFEGAKDDLPKQRELLFDKLGQELGKVDGQPFDKTNKAHLDFVDREYRRLASEFALESTYHCSVDAFELLVDPEKTKQFVERFNHLLEARGKERLDAEAMAEFGKRLGISARLTMIYGVYDLGEAGAPRLLETLRQKFPDKGAAVDELARLAEQLKNDPGAALPGGLHEEHGPAGKLTIADIIRSHWGELTWRTREHFLSGFGIERRYEVKVAHQILLSENLVWNWRKYGREQLRDAGSLDALAQILLASVESQGDLRTVAWVAGREFLFNVPIAGQVASVANSGLAGGWQGTGEAVGLMGLGMSFPVAGQMLVAYSIGSAGFEIYEMEVDRPRSTNLEDAIYRGFSGPELREYGEAPAQFTASDEKKLSELESQLHAVRAKYSGLLAWQGPKTFDAPYSPEAVERGLAEAEVTRATQELTPQIAALSEKKNRWDYYQKDRNAWAWMGGMFLGDVSAILGGSGLGPGAEPKQKPFTPSLLDAIEPMYGFLPGAEGLLDLTVLKPNPKREISYDPATSPAKLATLNTQRRSAADVRTRLQTDADYHELLVQSNRYARATRYLAAAQKTPELLYRLRRDSIWPALITYVKEPSYERYVRTWYERNKAPVVAMAVSNGMVSATIVTGTTIGRYGEPGERTVEPRKELPPEHITQLVERFDADAERSKRLFQEYERREKDRLAKRKENVERAVRDISAQAAGRWVEEQISTEAYTSFLDAVRIATIKPNPPKLRVDLYLTPRSTNTVTWSEDRTLAGDRPYEVAVHTRLTANPLFYRGDPANSNSYKTTVHYLNEIEARNAVSIQSAKGVPLLTNTVTALQHVLDQARPVPDKEELLVAVVSAFSKEMPNLDVVLRDPTYRKAVEHLPGLAARERTEHGHLMAQAVAYGLVPHGSFGTADSGPVRSTATTNKITLRFTDKKTGKVIKEKSVTIFKKSSETYEEAVARTVESEKKNYPEAEVGFEK